MQPNATTAPDYLAYLPLFQLLKGRAWLLTPKAASVTSPEGAATPAQANVFQVVYDGGPGDRIRLVASVIGGLPNTSVQLHLTLPMGADVASGSFEFHYPGGRVERRGPVVRALQGRNFSTDSQRLDRGVESQYPMATIQVDFGSETHDGCVVVCATFDYRARAA